MAKITTYYKGDMLFESKLGNHSVIIDVPAGMGGQDRGPTPPELFIASTRASRRSSTYGPFLVERPTCYLPFFLPRRRPRTIIAFDCLFFFRVR